MRELMEGDEVSGVAFGFLTHSPRLAPLNDVENTCTKRSRTFTFELYLSNSLREVCTAGINLGVSDVEITSNIIWV